MCPEKHGNRGNNGNMLWLFFSFYDEWNCIFFTRIQLNLNDFALFSIDSFLILHPGVPFRILTCGDIPSVLKTSDRFAVIEPYFLQRSP